jgi:histidyl-tRNA synthetase
VTLKLNTLGDSETREAWRQALVRHFEAHRGDLSEDSLARLDKNPLRILDSKDAKDRPIADAAPGIDDHMSSEAGAFFAAVTKGLDAAGVTWTRDARLVRGLDYYRHTAFEFVTDRLGAQGTVLGGGRYDGLIETLGGPHTPAVGWAAGIERLAMLIEAPAVEATSIALMPMAEAFTDLAAEMGFALRHSQIRCTFEYRFRKPQKAFDRFIKAGVRYTLEIGRSDDATGLAHVRMIYGSELTDEIKAQAIAIENALSMRFKLRGVGGVPHSSTGWDLLARHTRA